MKKRYPFFSVFMMLAMLASLVFQVTPAYARPLSAGAGDANTVLIYGPGTSKAVWNDQAVAAGFTVEVADDTAWNAKTTADFATYKAIIIPDNMCFGPSATVLANRATWGAAVTGNLLIIGGDPDYHAPSLPGATQLIYNGIEFAGADSTGKTGALIPLGCFQDVTILDPFGTFTSRGLSSDDIHMVASHPALTGLTDAALSNWGSSTHTAFTSFPADFIPLAIQNGATGEGVLSFPDGTSGTPYLLARGEGLVAVGSPTITSIVPNSGSVTGGTSVVITGTDFTGATTFTFGGTAATCTVDLDTQVTCTSPAHSAGAVDVVVTTPSGTATSVGGFTYTPTPTVYNLTVTASGPATVLPGSQYTYSFAYTTTASASDTQIAFALPDHTTYASNTGGYICTPSAGVVTCALGTVSADGSFNVTVNVDKLKKIGTPLTLAATAYSISATGAPAQNGTAVVTANTLNPFTDVPNNHWALDSIQSVWAYGITYGCAVPNPLTTYCPGQPITRGEMSIFIERAVHGGSYNPGTPSITFTDTNSHFARYFIEALKSDGITAGCGQGDTFCPESNITRVEMSVFLLRGQSWPAVHIAPVSTGMWLDVPVTHWGISWADELGTSGISSGCGSGYFCPNNAVLRSEMAVFVQRTFHLPMPSP